jgi:hypothetical protein
VTVPVASVAHRVQSTCATGAAPFSAASRSIAVIAPGRRGRLNVHASRH